MEIRFRQLSREVWSTKDSSELENKIWALLEYGWWSRERGFTYGMNLNEKVKHWKQNCKFKCLVKTADLNISLGLTSFFLSLSSAQFSHSVVSDYLRPHGLQHSRSPCPSPTLGVYSNSCHWVGEAIQPSHPLSSPSPLVFNLSQHQSLFKLLSTSHQVANVLEFQLQHQSFQWTSHNIPFLHPFRKLVNLSL